ncbi:MAG: (d)CMP kinase [Dissulfurimicrobium sp.]|uniref:(d)CMP kinase n=1 Tax=Dissulfurimicrobium TaxID=1769732 RepID=UPI001EDAF150|nr:(d)CMP kinase [Dissulfurimicrobium hydrothermale]UKL13305.1 (d)CMP kinase [Dissulfurimicrobium hydrothermale]
MTIITIDGPAGAGKSTISRLLAARLGYKYLDSGAMYRAVAWIVKKNGLDVTDEEAVSGLLKTIRLDFDFNNNKIIMNCKDISDIIRGPEMDALSSAVSRLKPVRDYLTRCQREIGGKNNIVAEGRDMGTVVFPAADFKFFITASTPERAMRRMRQLEAIGKTVNYHDMLLQIEARDAADSTRDLAPLKMAPDAYFIDTTGLTANDVLEKILILMSHKDNYEK